MTTVVLFHSVLGLRPAIKATADVLRGAGHEVITPDLYDGKVFDDMDTALRFYEEIGPKEMMARTQTSVAGLPSDLVYMGFSNGGVSAEWLAATRKGARACVLAHAAMALDRLGADSWPAGLPVQVHYAEHDPWRTEDGVDKLRAGVEASGSPFTFYEYPVTGHLFTDADLPEFDQRSADLLHQRVLDLLADLD